MTSITVAKGDKIIFGKLEDITYLKADEKCVVLYTNSEIILLDSP
jgi:co-chaperonin GroES (HSP10)|tara:strand:- start:455 stop:589 length:135 start_codon:yes stop_codon:yes gene_type:complete